MGKMVLYFSLLSLSILLFFGVVDPNSPVMWMASTSVSFSYLRLILIAVLAGLIVTNPPRNVYFRTFVGIVSLLIATWSLNATYNNEMSFLDTLALLQFSISAGLVVLERDYEDVAEKVQKHTKSATSKKRPAKARLATA